MAVESGGGPATTPRSFFLRGPRSAFRWTAYALAVTAFGSGITTPLYPVYAAEFHFDSAVLGLVFAGYTAGVLSAMFFAAPQAERLGRCRFLAIGLGLTIAAAGTFALANGVAVLAVARVVAGAGVGFTTSVATAAMGDLEPNRDHHHVARVAVAANFGGFALGCLLGGLFDRLGPDPLQLVYTLPIAAAVLALFAIRAVPETGTDVGRPRTSLVQRITIPRTVRGSFWVAAGGLAACYSIYGFFGALVPSYVRTVLGNSDPALAGGTVAIMFGTAAAVQLATAQLRDRRALLVGFPLLLAGLVALVLILPLASWTGVLAVAALVGVGVGLTFMGSTTLVDRVAPENDRGEMLAGFYSVGYLSLAVPTIGIAVASVEVGLADAGELFGAILAVTVAGLFASIARTSTPPGGGGRPREPRPAVAGDRPP
jgi:MFS family permease